MQLQRKLSLGMLSTMEITAGAHCVSFLCQQGRDVHKGELEVTSQDMVAFRIMSAKAQLFGEHAFMMVKDKKSLFDL